MIFTRFLIAGLLITSLAFFVMACSNNTESTSTDKPGKEKAKKDTASAPAPVAEVKRAPVINLTDTLSVKRIVISMKDSAATMERISLKLAEIYGVKLAAVMKKNNLKMAGAPMAWYKSQKAPYFFEAGVAVDKKPAKLAPGVIVKEMGIDSVLVAHFYGPYDLTSQAYEVLRDQLKERKKTLKGAPYEIYVDDPFDAAGKPKDPYKVQTDIVFPWK